MRRDRTDYISRADAIVVLRLVYVRERDAVVRARIRQALADLGACLR